MKNAAFWKNLRVLIIYSGEGGGVPDRAESSVITVKNNSAGAKRAALQNGFRLSAQQQQREHTDLRARQREAHGKHPPQHLKQPSDAHPQLCEMRMLEGVITENSHQ